MHPFFIKPTGTLIKSKGAFRGGDADLSASRDFEQELYLRLYLLCSMLRSCYVIESLRSLRDSFLTSYMNRDKTKIDIWTLQCAKYINVEHLLF